MKLLLKEVFPKEVHRQKEVQKEVFLQQKEAFLQQREVQKEVFLQQREVCKRQCRQRPRLTRTHGMHTLGNRRDLVYIERKVKI